MARQEIATFGGGCFWCTEAVFKDLKGVSRVVSGYTGGEVENPSYQEVCGGRTGHAEAVQITFDPDVVSYEDLLRVFFATHDPTTRDRQGNDVGPQYRSAVFTAGAEQDAAARRVVAELAAEKIWPAPIVTEITPLERFYAAEDYHQDYFAKNPFQPYCRAVVAPKVAKFRSSQYARLRA